MLSKKQKDVLDFITNYINGRGYSPSYSEIAEALGLSSKSTVFKHIQSLTERGFIKNIQGKKRTLQVIGNRENLIRLIKDTKSSHTRNGIINSNNNNIDINNTVIAMDNIGNAGDIVNNNNDIVNYNSNNDILNTQRSFIHLYGYVAAGYPIEAIQTDEMIELPEILAENSGKKLFALKVRGDSMIEDMILDGDIIILKECYEVPPNGKIVAAIVNDYEATLKRYYALENGMIKLMPSNPAYKPIIISKSKVKIIGELKGLIRKYGF